MNTAEIRKQVQEVTRSFVESKKVTESNISPEIKKQNADKANAENTIRLLFEQSGVSSVEEIEEKLRASLEICRKNCELSSEMVSKVSAELDNLNARRLEIESGVQ